MRELRYKAEELGNVIIPLGIQGETGATTIRIDFSEWLLDGTEGYPVILVLNPDGVAYPAATNRADEGDAEAGEESRAIVEWPISDIDTGTFGDGVIRLLLYSPDGVLLKSASARTNLAPSFIKQAGDAPDQYEYWLEQLTAQAAATGTDRLAAQTSAAAAAKSEEAAANSLAAVMTYADIAKAAAAAVASGEGDSSPLDIVMNLTTSMGFAIGTDEWTAEENGGYSVTLANEIITGYVSAIFMPDKESAPMMNDSVVLVCSAGQVKITTGALPSGKISGTLILCGRFAPEGAEDDGASMMTTWPRRASLSIGTVESVRFEKGASVSITEGNTLNFSIPAGKNLTMGTVTTVPYGTPAAASITGDNVLNLVLPRGEKGETGDANSNLSNIGDKEAEAICEEIFGATEAESGEGDNTGEQDNSGEQDNEEGGVS